MMISSDVIDESRLKNDPFEFIIAAISLRYRRFPSEIINLKFTEISSMYRYILLEKKQQEEMQNKFKK